MMACYTDSFTEYYATIKGNKYHATTWMDLRNIILSKRNQTQKYRYCMISFLYLKIGETNTCCEKKIRTLVASVTQIFYLGVKETKREIGCSVSILKERKKAILDC